MAIRIITMTMVMAMIAGMSSAGVIAPVLPPVPVAPVPIAYTKAVPLNIPPFSSRLDISNRVLASPYIHNYYATAGNIVGVGPAPVSAPLAYGPTVLG